MTVVTQRLDDKQTQGQSASFALEIVENLNHRITKLRSKSWDEFAGPGPHRSILYSRFAIAAQVRSARYGRVDL